MSRSPGITASAVIAILGSLAVGALGAFTLLGGLMLALRPGIPATQSPYPTPVPVAAVLIIETLFFIGFAVFGIVSAIGLLRLKNWARICFVVFAVILAFGAGSSVLGGVIAVVAMPQMVPPNADVPQSLMTGVMVGMVAIGLMLGALAVWWLIYFSRRTIKAEFMGEAAAALPRRGPLSITIIAWMLVVAGFWMVISVLLTSTPALLLGLVIEGWASRLIYFLYAGVTLTAGIGLLKWQRWAISLTIGFYAFTLVNTVLSFLTGAITRMMEIIQQRMPPTPYPVFPASTLMQITMVFALLFSAVIFWLLISRRRAFLTACESPAPTAS